MLTTYPKTESGLFWHLCHKLAESLWDPHTHEAMKREQSEVQQLIHCSRIGGEYPNHCDKAGVRTNDMDRRTAHPARRQDEGRQAPQVMLAKSRPPHAVPA